MNPITRWTFNELHAVVQIEPEVSVLNHIILLGHEVGHQFEILRGTGSGIVPGFRRGARSGCRGVRRRGGSRCGLHGVRGVFQVALEDIPHI